MGKYIDADHLRAFLQKKLESYKSKMVDPLKYPIDHIDLMALLAREYQALIIQIDSLQQEQPKVNLEEEIAIYLRTFSSSFGNGIEYAKNIARHFYELGQREMRHRIMNPEYNAKVVERLKSEYPARKEE